MSDEDKTKNETDKVEDWMDEFRLRQDFDNLISIESITATVPVGKPGPQDWFRIHSDANWRFQTAMLELKDDKSVYLISPHLWPDLIDEIKPVILFTGVTRQKKVFIWPVRIAGPDGTTDKYMESDLIAAKQAESKWTRRYWVPTLKSHKIMVATGITAEPEWPKEEFKTLLDIAFKDKVIRDRNHPVLKTLRGEI